MTEDDLRALRELAEKATPGPWIAMTGGAQTIWADHRRAIAVMCGARKRADHERDANAQWIVAANPTALLALLDHIEALTAERDRLRALLVEARNALGNVTGYASKRIRDGHIDLIARIDAELQHHTTRAEPQGAPDANL
jgi:hypothetical protein